MHLLLPNLPVFPGATIAEGLTTASIQGSGIGIHVAAIVILGIAFSWLIQRMKWQQIQILVPPTRWLAVSVISWMAACTASIAQIDANLCDQIWYWAAVVSCCSPISVLGAKRPTSRVWTAFIVVPLIAVLGWPAIAAAFVKFPDFVPIQLQVPAMLGFALVLIMGYGNYLGTRLGGSACLAVIAIILNLLAASNLIGWTPSGLVATRATAALLYGISVLGGIRQTLRPSLEADQFDNVWFDFRDAFGLVWSIRIQDRINQIAEAEKWCVRLGSAGFVWDGAANEDDRKKSRERLSHTLHWLLRRFVEPEWIDRRLNENHDE